MLLIHLHQYRTDALGGLANGYLGDHRHGFGINRVGGISIEATQASSP